jgi:predicted regulator of Ras-like GTPase activity (Roadblock/LC7/MglB family)/tetratricopeptide (TPR) repeat protein
MALFGGPSQPVTRLEELKRLLQRDPASRQFLALAEEYRRHGKYRDSVITLERGLTLHANSVAGHVALGKAYQQLDRLEDAIRAFTTALRIDRENLVAIRQLAEVYLAKGDKVEAIKKLKLYRGLKPGERDVNEIIGRLEREMSAAVGPGFRSGVRPAVEVPPGFVPPSPPPSSGASRRAALLRRLDVHPAETVPAPAPAGLRPSDRLELTYAGASAARVPEKVEPRDGPPSPVPLPPDDVFETAPAPAPASGEIPAFTMPIQQIRDEIEAAAFPPPAPPASEPAAVAGSEGDLDDVPTAPFEFPAHLQRVGAAPEPAPGEPASGPPAVTETLAAIYESQGFSAAARETYRALADSEADEARARALREKAAALPATERADRPHLRRFARRFPKREDATANDLHVVIRALVDSSEGIRAATLTDLEGLPVVTAGPAAREPEQEILVAELTSFLKGVGRTVGEIGAGTLRGMTFTGAHGTAVVSRVNDDYSLILHVGPDAILGEVRWEAERAARALGPAVR